MHDSKLKDLAGVIQVKRARNGLSARVRARREAWNGMCKGDRLSYVRREHTGRLRLIIIKLSGVVKPL